MTLMSRFVKQSNVSMVYESSEDKIQAKMATFPRDILFCILSRLPLKSVLRFCCVSKLWLDVIKSPEFGYLHSKKSAGDPTLLILSHRLLKENIISISPISLRGHHLHISDNSISNLVGSCSLNLVGACNGFLCFASFDHERILVCNPITIEFVILPKPGTTLPPEPLTIVYGFGFDSTSETYKVVRVSYSEGSLHGDANLKVSVEVYNLGATGSWRAVRDFQQPPYGLPVFANGHLHCISELGGCLSVVDLRKRTLIEVWVLKDQFNNYWQQEYILPVGVPYGLDMGLPRLISISEKNGVLLIWLQDAIFSYEQRTLSRKKLLISGLPSWLDWEICCGFRPSLAPLRGNLERLKENMDVAYFTSDMEIYSQPIISSQIVEYKAIGRCDGLVSCFVKNGMLVP
uniref:F-box domain-containing protein n=1 Tax=Musa acuminata subsp. malaccensis TaxID=214687 RepID=A0A804KXX8_MUSAM